MEFLKIFAQILAIASTILAGFYIPYMNFRQKKRDEENKKQLEIRDAEIDRKQEIRIKKVTERLEEIESTVNHIEISLKTHLVDDTFRKEFRELIRNTSIEIIERQYMLNQVYKNILSYYSDSIERFGLLFYYSKKRKEEQWDRDKVLSEEKIILLDDFSKYIDSNVDSIKIYDKHKTHMSDFLKKNNCFASLEILVNDLIRNGLSDSDVKDKFRIHIDKFFKVFITSTIVWDSLQSPKFDSNE